MQPEILQEWLPGRRWFGGKGRDIAELSVAPSPWLVTDPPVRIELATVRYDNGDTETYQVPVEYRETPADHLNHALIGRSLVPELGESPYWAYDALHDKDVTGTWLRGMHNGRHEAGLSFHQEPTAGALSLDEPSLVLSAEQSNTSLVFGDAVILKIFRKLTDGLNPDVELHHALAQVENPYVAALLGWVDGTWPDIDDTADGPVHSGTLAIAQEFLKSATSGWELALTSLRALFAEPDIEPAESGADFASEANRLGQATATVHADLAKVLGSEPLSAEDLALVAQGMTDRLEAAVAVVPELASAADAIAKVYTDFAACEVPVRVQRVHGDLHLGQVVRTLSGWRLLDFEGEPARPVEERRVPHSPLKDVAGMLRSLDYAARHLLADRPHADAALEYRADQWAARNQQAFCDGYADVSGHDVMEEPLPLRAFTLDKAVYEVVYEARNRPGWLEVPLSAIARLTA
jgi:maltokinase